MCPEFVVACPERKSILSLSGNCFLKVIKNLEFYLFRINENRVALEIFYEKIESWTIFNKKISNEANLT